ncbi:MAG: hypothetical protein Kow0089_10980 [Desulfobulbaceae bacterium]
MEKLLQTVRFLLVMLLLGFVWAGSACAEAGSLDASQKLFFSRFRYAVQAHDPGQLIRLTHPESLSCVPEEDREFYYGRMLDGLGYVLGKRQAIRNIRVEEYAPGELVPSRDLPSGDDVRWPVVPQARIILEYERQGRKAVASLYLARDQNDWKWVHICVE